jgi:alpha-glucuronidase
MKIRFLCLFVCGFVHAESGYDAWLRYTPLDESTARRDRDVLSTVSVFGDSEILRSAQGELIRGVRGMLGRTLREEPNASGVVLGKLSAMPKEWGLQATLTPEAFWLKTVRVGAARYTIVAGGDDRGVLYGTFALLRKIALKEPIDNLDEKQAPATAVRWVNHWDNLDGTIERGYAGRSIFWEGLHARADMARVSDYGRLLASLGINGCSINNVNANPRILAPDFLPEIAKIATALRPWGVRVAISVDFGSPKAIGGLDTFDPLERGVIQWWKNTVDGLYRGVPDLAGIIIKADSEGRVGPSAYNRTHADAANVVARALAPHGGMIFYRGFVYDHHMDWNNPKNDRARAADDNFRPLDGKFDSNVMIQVKNGPIDFQVREPVSPLFGTLEKSNTVLEFQITQEYFGQAKHTVFLAPMWKEVLDFDLRGPVKKLVKGIVGVSNEGLDENWTGNHLSQANLYSFGRLTWNADLTAKQLSDEWTRLSFGDDPKVLATVNQIQLSSWRTYENYTGVLGLQGLTDIVGNHYGVAVEASENNGWGQWHRADAKDAGMDRTVATGTGYIGQYRPEIARMYESVEQCPDDLLLFMHHVPYTHKLHDGKTVIQYIYDSHYDGADAVEGYVRQWRGLKGLVDERRYREILAQFEYQAGQAEEWRDAVVGWFFKTSGIPDVKGRAGRHPNRFEAETMTLDGYKVTNVTPWETASGEKAVACGASTCTASMKYEGRAGWRTIKVRYFDQNNGNAKFRILVGNQAVDEWTASGLAPSAKLDGSTSSRRITPEVLLKPGDEIRIEGTPDRGESAALDYIEILPAGV